MIASAGVTILVTAFWGDASSILLENTNWTLVILFIVSIILLRKIKINPVWVMLLAGVLKVAASKGGL